MDHLNLFLDISELNLALLESKSIKGFLANCVVLVAKHLNAEVCSIYLFDTQNKTLTLSATHGLNQNLIDKVKLESNEGLVGLVMEELNSIRLQESSTHPSYKFFPGLLEERYDSFCAVPVVHGIMRIGVITVQRNKISPFTENDEKTLKGVANQLASIIEYTRMLAIKNETDGRREKTLKFIKGRPASTGYALAPVKINRRNIILSDIGKEAAKTPCSLKDFMNAVEKVAEELMSFQRKVEERFADADSLIFAAHLMLLKDEQYVGKMINRIKENLHPALAVIEVTEMYCTFFASRESAYLREKSDDIRDLGIRLLNHIRQSGSDSLGVNKKIVIARDLLISDIIILSAEGVAGIIMVNGGASSHFSILARSFNIPLVIADEERLLDLDDGVMALLDAESGNIYINPGREITAPYEIREKTSRVISKSKPLLEKTDTVTADGKQVKLMANINLVSDAKNAIELGADGIGLYRTEFPFIVRSDFPTEQEQYVVYKKLITLLPGMEITFRTLDVGGDKVLSYYHVMREQNPFLGMRSLRFCLENLSVFKQQIRAILRAGAGAPIRIMFPMVSSTDEFASALNVVDICKKELASENIEYNKTPAIGIMVEIPSALYVIEELAERADFFSIGTNDFIQYMLAVDRTNEKVAGFYCPHHPAVLRGIKQVVDAAHNHEKEVSICGDMAHNPRYAEFFLGIGVSSLSVEPVYIQSVRSAIAGIDSVKATEKAGKILHSGTIREIEGFLES